LRLAVEFASENVKLDPIPVAQTYFDWVMKKKILLRKSARISKINDEV